MINRLAVQNQESVMERRMVVSPESQEDQASVMGRILGMGEKPERQHAYNNDALP